MKRTIVIQFVVVLCLSVGALIAQEGKVSVERLQKMCICTPTRSIALFLS